MSLSIRIFIWLWVALLAVAGLMLVWPKLVPAKPQGLDTPLEEYRDSQIKKVARMFERTEKRRWIKHRQRMPDGSVLWIYDDQNQQFISEKVPPELADRALSMLGLDQPIVERAGHFWVMGPVPFATSDHHYTLFFGLPERVSRGAWLRQLVRQSPLLLTCVGLLLGGLAFVVARQIVKPLASLRATAEQIANGEFTATVPAKVINRKDEIGSLGRTVSSMGNTIDAALAAHKRLLSDVSHELRSPLTRLSLANTLAEKRCGKTEESERIRHESEVLNEMIEQLLSFSRMQLMPQHDGQTVSAMPIINSCLDNLKFSHPQLTLEFENNLAAQDCLLFGHSDLFKRAISNVLDNASRYAESKIKVALSEHNQQLTIVIEDDGCGVPEQELDKLFEPFYRPEFARDRERGGAGLGLAIVAQAVKFHGGKVWSTLGESGGLRVTMQIPIQQG